MKMKCFAVYDHKAKAFAQPFFQQTEGLAIRNFTAAVNEGTSPLGKYPEDFVLYAVGEWDDAIGRFTDCEPVVVIKAIQVVEVKAGNVTPLRKEN